MPELNPLLEQYRSAAVRDLVWALLSPTLINAHNANHNPSARWYLEAYHLIEPHLHTLDADDSTLVAHLNAQPNHRLGVYFERLWSYWLQHNDRYQLLAQNLQVMKAGQTLGEFDLIVLDSAADQVEHWELAVKFYLGIPPTRDMQHWFGTTTRDRLDLKYCHLVDKQLVLSETFPGRSALQERGWHIKQQRLISKGRLYYPYDLAHQQTLETPVCIDPPHLSAYWSTQTEFNRQALQYPDAAYAWLDKSEWMVRKNKSLNSLSSIQAILEQQLHPHPIQLWIEGWQATPLRLFVVPDTWPSAALATLPSQ